MAINECNDITYNAIYYNGNQLINIDIFGALFILSLSIFILNSRSKAPNMSMFIN